MSSVTATEWRSHWKVVFGSGLALACGYASYSYVASLFVQPLQTTFGWSRGTQAAVANMNLVAALLAPIFGHYVDRFGIRPIALTCMPLLGITYLALSVMNGPLIVYYLLIGFAVLVGQGTAGIVFIRSIVSWFDAARGTALAVSRIGISLAAAVLPPITYAVMAQFGWRTGYVLLGLIALLIGLPTIYFFVTENRLARRGPSPSWHASAAILRNRKVLTLCLAAGLTTGPVIGFLSQAQPLLVDKGIAPATAAMLAGTLAIAVLGGALVSGVLMDRLWAPLVGCLFTLAPVLGCLLLLSGNPPVAVAVVGVMMIGVALGAELDLVGYLIGRYFGLDSFAAIFGTTTAALGLFTALCVSGYGLAYDYFGNYDAALIASAFLFFCASMLYLTLGPYPEQMNAVSPMQTGIHAAGDGGAAAS